MAAAPRKRPPSRRALAAHRLALLVARPLIRPHTLQASGRPRVTFVVMSAYGMSGISRTVLTVAGELAAGYDVAVVSVRRRRKKPFFAVPPGVRLIAVDHVGCGPTPSRLGRAVRAVLRRFRGRLVHPGDVAARKTTLWTDLMLVARLRRLRSGVVICTRPSLNIIGSQLVRPGLTVIGQEHMHLARRGTAKQAAIRRSHGKLSAVVVLTESDRREYRAALGDATRIVAIPNPVPALGGGVSDVSRPVVVAVGRLTAQKGFDRLIDVFADVTREAPDWTLHICGRGRDRRALQARIAKRGLAGKVILRGAVRDIGHELEQASLFVLSSRWEGFPMVLVEAMSKGLPIVSFDCRTGPADIVDHGRTGLLVPNGDRKALAGAMLELMRDPSRRRRFSAAAVERAEQFSPARIGARWEELLTELRAADQPPRRFDSFRRSR